MNILYHHRTRGTGAEGVHIAHIIKALRQLGHNVEVVSPTGEDPTRTAGGNPFAQGKGGRTGILTRLSRYLPQFLFELLEIGYNVSAWGKLVGKLRRKHYDLVYERNAFFLFAGALAARFHRVRYFVEVNEIAGEKRVRKQVLTGLAKWVEHYVFKRADALFVVSEFLRERIRERGISGKKVMVMPNGVDPKVFTPDVSTLGLRDEYGIAADAVVAGFIGWFVPWHNLSVLLEVFAAVARDKNAVLLLVGDGMLKEELAAQAKKLGIREKVVFSGAVPYGEVPAHIAIMDVCVIPGSNEYRSPIKMFEYMAMQKPVIAPRLRPIQRVIDDELEGVLFTQGDAESLGGALSELITHEDKRETMGLRARAKVLEKHTWLKNAQRIAELALQFAESQ